MADADAAKVTRNRRPVITTTALRILAESGDADAQFRLAYRLAYGRSRVPEWAEATR